MISSTKRIGQVISFSLLFTAAAVAQYAISKTPPTAIGPIKTSRFVRLKSSGTLGRWTKDKLIEVHGYDAKGQLTERCIYERDERSLIGRIVHTYDSEGKLVEINSYDVLGSLVGKDLYHYQSKGRLSVITHYTNGSLSYKETHVWTLSGKRVEVASLYPPNEWLARKEIVKFSDKGRILEAAFHNADGSLGIKELYKYDKNGNPVRLIIRDAYGAVIGKVIYKYEFDAHGNWTKQTKTYFGDSNSSLSRELINRTVVYY